MRVKMTQKKGKTSHRQELTEKKQRFEDIFALAEPDYSPSIWGELDAAIKKHFAPKKKIQRSKNMRKTSPRAGAQKRQKR